MDAGYADTVHPRDWRHSATDHSAPVQWNNSTAGEETSAYIVHTVGLGSTASVSVWNGTQLLGSHSFASESTANGSHWTCFYSPYAVGGLLVMEDAQPAAPVQGWWRFLLLEDDMWVFRDSDAAPLWNVSSAAGDASPLSYGAHQHGYLPSGLLEMQVVLPGRGPSPLPLALVFNPAYYCQAFIYLDPSNTSSGAVFAWTTCTLHVGEPSTQLVTWAPTTLAPTTAPTTLAPTTLAPSTLAPTPAPTPAAWTNFPVTQPPLLPSTIGPTAAPGSGSAAPNPTGIPGPLSPSQPNPNPLEPPPAPDPSSVLLISMFALAVACSVVFCTLSFVYGAKCGRGMYRQWVRLQQRRRRRGHDASNDVDVRLEPGTVHAMMYDDGDLSDYTESSERREYSTTASSQYGVAPPPLSMSMMTRESEQRPGEYAHFVDPRRDSGYSTALPPLPATRRYSAAPPPTIAPDEYGPAPRNKYRVIDEDGTVTWHDYVAMERDNSDKDKND